jgi:hypothetical protein
MAEQIQRDTTDRSNTRSSMSVSRETICEDEACIGKGVNPATAAPAETGSTDKKTAQSTRSSMAVSGREICADDACIGKE